MINDLKLRDGIIIYDDLTHWLALDKENICQNASWHGEDLMQISFDNQLYIIDVGWYPATDIDGSFAIVVIKNQDWDNYLFHQNTRTYNGLIKSINNAVDFIYSKKANT